MLEKKGKSIKKKKIFNKNYIHLKKNKKKAKGKKCSENVDERSQLQKEIDEKLEKLVEENKRKQYNEQWKNKFTKNNDYNEKKDKNECNEEKKEKKYKNNLTIIDKNVLTSQEFKTLPISKRTLKALNENNFIYMTNIQEVSIPIVLLNKHIYAQAQTGTGKTLCFCIPLVEKMYRNSIDCYNKILGGLIITPTRELVFQIFEVLNMLNKYHKLNICCVIGGKNEEKEKSVFSYANIIVCTTGRLLYHLENNYFCNLDYLSVFIIDEIDKLIDKSFYDNLKNILLYKPKENCQICLFSATICKFLNVILQTFNIKDYEYVSINDNDKYIENNNVKQIYIECNIYDKINYLYTFLFSKKNKKIIVFFSTCKQVRFMFEVFKKIKVGVMKFLQLHGKLKQTSRLNTYHFFSKKKNFVCLFTTDIACRGLDFASVDWVIHFDFPENVETFIHRSGRTGRFTNIGNSLIFLTSEIDNKKIFLNVLKENNIEIKEKFIKKQKLFDINNKIHSLNAAFVEIKYLAKKALIIYLRHLYIVMKFKDIKKIDLNKLAYSYGLIEFSNSMLEELNLIEQKKIEVKKKKSRLEKFLEILKNKKQKKNNEYKEELKDDTNKCDLNNNIDNNNEFKMENKQNLDTFKGDVFKINKDLPNTNEKESDDIFIQKKVEIQDNIPIMLPTKKRRKRVRVAKTLSNSVLYDDNGNEIFDDNIKFRILVNELNEEEKHEEKNRDVEDNIVSGKAYIESLKEKVKKYNQKLKIKKLRKKENLKLNNKDVSSCDEYSDQKVNICSDQNEQSCDSSSDSQYHKYEENVNDHFIKNNENKKRTEDLDKINRNQKDNLNEDVSELENRVMMFL
ncbi:DEAD/DEAH box ATP-dependent RNA helicase, putative [Plasmodium gallinaceum]|uniref:ATP-dependent RNA helicase n=1 Tax=Plasmodium gallinaceum TaxID=5849 RepID=A0A1J1GTC8_PLAGA|nr:DEAD/DEAH box ATP-dependent RNA helicase, putative [Plasmodium gallinaceum]CRG95703.1 DEAD/DEAH box ATP-dependent RNA helicase, putative [Plasmodium gallinaceum]